MATVFQPIGFSTCSRAEQGWKLLLPPNKISNQRAHLLQGTVQTKAIPNPQSQHSEAFTQQSCCPLNQMVGSALYKAIHSCVLAG